MRPVGRSLRRLLGPRLIPLAAWLLIVAGCRAPERYTAPSVHPEASLALEEARRWMRREGPEAAGRARAAAQRAYRRQPDWVAPRRMLDRLARSDLLGVEALARHRAALDNVPLLAAEGDAAGTEYLAGRLEGRQGAGRFQRAVALDGDLAWGYHGLAWIAAGEGDLRRAVRYERRALERARDGQERSMFVAALARFHAAAEEPRRALAVLNERIDDPETGPIDLIELSVQAALLELTLLFQPEAERGLERALELLRENDLTDAEVEDLTRSLQLFPRGDGRGLDLQLALAARSSPARDRLRAELMLQERPTPLALGLLHRARRAEGRGPNTGPLMRAARFAAGQFEAGVEEWLADLPGRLLDADGLPRDARLAQVVSEARALDGEPGSLARFGDTLVAAGWFDEARAVASQLATENLAAALALEDRGAAGRSVVLALRRLIEDRNGRGSLFSSRRAGRSGRRGGSSPGRSLRDLLAELAPAVARARALLGGESDSDVVAAELATSPFHAYGFFGDLVHPGPFFSAADEAAGLGARGETVPGLAEELGRLGRFGLLGEMMGGGGPDGTVLRRVLVEPLQGEHLGAPWSGTVAWCEGVDVASRAARMGASISGAALHEGYWIDIDTVRRERDQWVQFQLRMGAHISAERLHRALASRGLALRTPRTEPERRRGERRSIDTLLGESERMRLAVLRDRAGPDGDARTAPPVTLEELVAVTAVHEEAHLCDRARFLPLSQNLGRVLRLLLSTGVSATGVVERLEYRAQLVALCEASDPRLPWVEILRAAEAVEGGAGRAAGVTVHAGAYRDLLADLVLLLERDLELHPERWPELDGDHVLAHQLHHLPPERLREIALVLARREGLDRP